MREACDQAVADRIGYLSENDRNRARLLLQGSCRGQSQSVDGFGRYGHKLGSSHGCLCEIPGGEAVFKVDVLAVDPSGTLHRILERWKRLTCRRVVRARCIADEHTYLPHPLRLLRLRRERPSC